MKANWWRAPVVVILAVAVAAVLIGCSRDGSEEAAAPDSTAGPEMAEVATETEETPPTPAVDETATESDAKNLPKLREFSSKTCPPCRRMEPIIQELKKRYSGRLEVEVVDVQ